MIRKTAGRERARGAANSPPDDRLIRTAVFPAISTLRVGRCGPAGVLRHVCTTFLRSGYVPPSCPEALTDDESSRHAGETMGSGRLPRYDTPIGIPSASSADSKTRSGSRANSAGSCPPSRGGRTSDHSRGRGRRMPRRCRAGPRRCRSATPPSPAVFGRTSVTSTVSCPVSLTRERGEATARAVPRCVPSAGTRLRDVVLR